MDDAVFVCRVERVRDLRCDRQGLFESDGSLGEPMRKILALDELHDQCGDRAGLFQPVDVGDVRVIERGKRLCFARKSRQTFGIGCKLLGQDLQRDIAIELRVVGPKHLPHSTCANLSDDFVDAEASASGEGQRCGLYRWDGHPHWR